MKKFIELSPFIAVAIIFVILLGLFAAGAFDAPEEMTITTHTLTEMLEVAELSTAKYIQHGIAKAHIEGKEDGFILYYATVRATIDVNDIEWEVDKERKVITVTLPEQFSIEVELLQDETHKFYYYPEEKGDWSAKEAQYICKTDARQKAEANTEFMSKARESLVGTIEALLSPILTASEYTLTIQ